MKRLKYLGIFVFVVVGLMLFSGVVSANGCGCDDCCDVHSPGYWKNHPDEWPVETITIGGQSFTQSEAIEIMKLPVKGDKRLTLFKALVSANLNVMHNGGADCCLEPCPDCGGCHDSIFVSEIIAYADEWFGVNHIGPITNGRPDGPAVRANTDPWQDCCGDVPSCSGDCGGEYLYDILDRYNNEGYCLPIPD